MHQQIKNNAHCRSGILFFGHLKRAVSEDRASRMRVERTGEQSEEEARGGVVARRSRGWEQEEGDSAWPLLDLFHRALVYACLIPGLWASRSPRSCLIFLSPNPSAGWGRKAEGGGEQGSEEHPLGAKPLTGKARLPRDTARTAEGDWASSSQAPLGCLRLRGWPHDAHLTHLQMRSTSPSIPPTKEYRNDSLLCDLVFWNLLSAIIGSFSSSGLLCGFLLYIRINFNRASGSPPANAGDARHTGSTPRSGRSPGGRHGNPLHYSFLDKPIDGGAWRSTAPWGAKSWTWLKQLSTHTQIFITQPIIQVP